MPYFRASTVQNGDTSEGNASKKKIVSHRNQLTNLNELILGKHARFTHTDVSHYLDHRCLLGLCHNVVDEFKHVVLACVLFGGCNKKRI